MNSTARVYAFFLLIFLLAACAPLAAVEPSPTPLPTATAAPTPTLTPEPTATPALAYQPVPLPARAESALAVSPPDFSQAQAAVQDGVFDLVDAQAVYAWYRQDVGPSAWLDEASYLAEMQAYLDQLEGQGIRLVRAESDGIRYTLLARGNQVLLDFDPNGALREPDPGSWSAESTQLWIDAGGPVGLFTGEDQHAYIVRLDAQGKVAAYLNTLEATRDSINSQWIPVENGQVTSHWFGELGWVESSATAQTDQGPVTVKDGKLYAFDQSKLAARQTNLAFVVFDTIEDASKMVLASYPDEFQNQDKLYQQLFPGGKPSIFFYKVCIDQMSVATKDNRKTIELIGIPVEFVVVKNPDPTLYHEKIVLAMLKLYGLNRPLPLFMGVLNGDRFRTTNFVALQYTADNYAATMGHGEPLSLPPFRFKDLRAMLLGEKPILKFSTLLSTPPEQSQQRIGPKFVNDQLPVGYSYEDIAALEEMGLFQANNQGIAFHWMLWNDETDADQSGELLQQLIDGSPQVKNVLFVPNQGVISLIRP